MYTFHVWIVLSDSVGEDDLRSVDDFLSPSELKKLPLVRQRIWEAFGDQIRPRDPIAVMNGLFVLQMSLCRNHRGDSHTGLLDVLNVIGDELPGSYGLTYWNDDEVEDPTLAGGFQVIVMARGQLQQRTDPFLSPLNPVIED